MIHLFQGNIFSSKCDLIIIPCNSKGGVTDSIENELAMNDVPALDKPIAAGRVRFIFDFRRLTIASVIGHAASVDVSMRASNEDILRSILQSIQQCCKKYSLQKVNIPLLGTGAGRLPVNKAYEIM